MNKRIVSLLILILLQFKLMAVENRVIISGFTEHFSDTDIAGENLMNITGE